jgi:hypothetical protein
MKYILAVTVLWPVLVVVVGLVVYGAFWLASLLMKLLLLVASG